MTTVGIVVLLALAQTDGGVEGIKDVGRLDSLGQRFDTAVTKKDWPGEAKVEKDLRDILKHELNAMRARSDADEKTLKTEKQKPDGGINPRRVLAREDIRIGGRLFEIDNDFALLEGKTDEKSLDKKRMLIDQLIGLAEQERRREGREKRLDEKPDAGR
jgi:hypothetical protein